MRDGLHQSKLYALVVLMTAAPTFAGWDIDGVSCPNVTEKSQASWVEKLRSAEPTDPYYVPNPYPQSKDAVIENFLFAQTDIWSDTALDELPAGERFLFRLLKESGVRFELIEVREWSGRRCKTSGHEVPNLLLLRIFDRTSGRETARASFAEDGSLRQVLFLVGTHPAPADPNRAELFEDGEIGNQFSTRVDVSAESVQWVSSSGTVYCSETVPCVAFRSVAGEVYLVSPKGLGGKLFRLSLEERSSLGSDQAAYLERQARVRELAEQGRELVGVGAGQLVVADPVP